MPDWTYLLSDRFLFTLFEICFIVFAGKFLYADLFPSRGSIGLTVKRGEGSRKIFTYVFISVWVVFISEVILPLEILGGFRLIIFFTHVWIGYYLCFISPNFRNKIVGWGMKLEKKIDKLS